MKKKMNAAEVLRKSVESLPGGSLYWLGIEWKTVRPVNPKAWKARRPRTVGVSFIGGTETPVPKRKKK